MERMPDASIEPEEPKWFAWQRWMVSIPPLMKLHNSLSVFSHHTLSALFGHDFDIQDLSCHS